MVEILAAYDWLVLWLLKSFQEEYELQLRNGKDPFTAKNDSQVYCARSLAIAYIEVSLSSYRNTGKHICDICNSDLIMFNIYT